MTTAKKISEPYNTDEIYLNQRCSIDYLGEWERIKDNGYPRKETLTYKEWKEIYK